ncbi:hypothetical protein [Streptomyces lydicus]|uniref:hypothetical protein n=1 Tax=Streptomyces lydicus TaxID=47763 RepID=UPI0037B02F44
MESATYPDDLLNAARARHHTYRTLAASPPDAGTTALRRRLLRLSCQVFWHPHWSTPSASTAGRVALRSRAQALESGAP